MMKKITLLMLTIITSLVGWSQLVVFEETFNNFTALADPPPAGWLTFDEDGQAVNTFYTDQGAFLNGNWEHMNFGAPFSPGIYSCSDVTPSTSAVDNWLISPAITLQANPLLSIEVVAAIAGELEVRYATTLAGATPAVSDFTNVLDTFNTTGNYTVNTIDLSSLATQTVYFAFRDNNAGGDIMGMRNFQILEQVADDIKIDNVVFDETKFTMDGLIVDYALFCGSSANVSIEVTNVGVNPITSFDAGFDNGSSLVNETFNITPLASGQSTTVTFTTPANIDTFDAYFIDAWVNMTADTIVSNDSTANLGGNLNLMVAAKPDTISLTNSFYTSFEQYDGNNLADIPNAFWTFEDSDGNGNAFSASDNTANVDFVSDGIYSLELLGNNASANNDWAFSPCMYFESTKGYNIKFRSRVGSFNTGAPVPATLDIHLMNDDNSANVAQSLGSIEVNTNESFGQYSLTFQPNTTGVYNMGIEQATTGIDWHVWIDEVEIEEITAPSAPIVSSTWNECDSIVSLSFSFDNTNTYTIDWGDGNTENVTSSPATHKYDITGIMYNVVVTATNVLGSNDGNTTVDASLLSTPDASFVIAPSGVDVSVTATSTLPCNTYTWSFGDGTPTTTGSSSNHTYTANGEYTITLIATNGAGTNSTSQTYRVSGIGINEIDFVNGINVFPNPVNDKLNVSFELNSTQDVSIELVSTDGRIVSSISNSASSINETINTSNLSSGLYILNITSDEGKFTKNVIVK